MADYKPELGKLITGVEHRDAIHVAVFPAVAAETVAPGQHVGIFRVDDGKYLIAATNDPIGIVDPFLKEYIHTGQQCWVLLYPGTASQFRTVYSHPAFSDRT